VDVLGEGSGVMGTTQREGVRGGEGDAVAF
jgi:hypothetical protein